MVISSMLLTPVYSTVVVLCPVSARIQDYIPFNNLPGIIPPSDNYGGSSDRYLDTQFFASGCNFKVDLSKSHLYHLIFNLLHEKKAIVQCFTFTRTTIPTGISLMILERSQRQKYRAVIFLFFFFLNIFIWGNYVLNDLERRCLHSICTV